MVLFAFLLLSPILILLGEGPGETAGLVSGRVWGLLANSLALSLGTAFLSVLIGVPLAFLFRSTDFPLGGLLEKVFLVPLVVPPYLHALLWGRGLLLSVSPTGEGPLPLSGLASGIFVFTLAFFPLVMLVTGSGLRAVNRGLEEISILSRGPLPTMGRITLPMVLPHIGSGAILVFAFTLVNFEAADVLGIRVYPVEIFIQFSAFYDERGAALLALPLVAAGLLLVAGQSFLMGGRSYADLGGGGKRPVYFLNRAKPWAVLFVLAILVAAVAAPLAMLVREAGSGGDVVRALLDSREEILYSLYVSALSATAIAVVGFFAAWTVERSTRWMRGSLDFLMQCPMGIPSVVLGIGLIRLWNRPMFEWVYGTSIVLVVGYASAYGPFVYKILASGFKQIVPEFEEAALFSTSSWMRICRRIVLPLAMPALLAGWFTAFAFSLSNLGTALLVVTAGKATLPIKLYNILHYGAKETVFALTLIQMGLIACAFALLCLGNRWARRFLRR